MKRPCLEPGCPDSATYRGRCTIHSKEREGVIHSKERKRIYSSKRWQILRRHKLHLNPICEDCEDVLATEVDHVIPIPQGDPWSLSNLQSLCGPCHSSKTRAEQLRGKGRVAG